MEERQGHVHFVFVSGFPFTNGPDSVSLEKIVGPEIKNSLSLVVWLADFAKLYLIGHYRLSFLYEIDNPLMNVYEVFRGPV